MVTCIRTTPYNMINYNTCSIEMVFGIGSIWTTMLGSRMQVICARFFFLQSSLSLKKKQRIHHRCLCERDDGPYVLTGAYIGIGTRIIWTTRRSIIIIYTVGQSDFSILSRPYNMSAVNVANPSNPLSTWCHDLRVHTSTRYVYITINNCGVKQGG